MRTTIDLPDDLHSIVTSLAVHQRATMSRTAAELIRRGSELPALRSSEHRITVHPVTGLPVVQCARVITPEDVAALDDADECRESR